MTVSPRRRLTPRDEKPMRPFKAVAGMTLLELAVAITVLLLFVGMSALGARAWKRGSDRAACVMNICQAQKAVRSLANLNGYNAGQEVRDNLEARVFGLDNFINCRPECPSGGTYKTTGNRIPEVGELYIKCSLGKSENHRPEKKEGGRKAAEANRQGLLLGR